jgi:hypothetical protein
MRGGLFYKEVACKQSQVLFLCAYYERIILGDERLKKACFYEYNQELHRSYFPVPVKLTTYRYR